jgi:hypothetical protein
MVQPPRKRGARKAEEPMPPDQNLSSVAVDMLLATEGVSIREVRAKIEEVFLALGSEALAGTVIPAGQKNNSREAADYVIADLLEKLATKRKKEALQAAEKAGVFGNPEDYVQGDTVMVFSDPNFSINVKMGNPSKMIGREEVEAAAERHFGKKASEFLEECSKERAATKQIIVSMK